MSALLQPMETAAICLLVPLAIIIGHRRPTGAVIVSGSAALVAAIIYGILLGSIFTPELVGDGSNNSGDSVVLTLLVYGGGVLLLITAWTLALHSAVWARRWGWVFLLVVAGYISFTSLILSSSIPDACSVGQVVTLTGTGTGCGEARPAVSLAFYASRLVGPVVATLYGILGMSSRRRPPVLRNVVVTPFSSTSTEEDTEPELT